MRYTSLPAFQRSVRKLSPHERSAVEAALERLTRFFDEGVRPEGLGLKKLRADTWEIRSGLHLRILFLLKDDEAVFILVGNHDDIRRYLR